MVGSSQLIMCLSGQTFWSTDILINVAIYLNPNGYVTLGVKNGNVCWFTCENNFIDRLTASKAQLSHAIRR